MSPAATDLSKGEWGMPIPLNPFYVAVAAAMVVLFAIGLISNKRNEARAGHGGPTSPVVVVVLAMLLVPVGIAIAALGGPAAGVVAYLALLLGGSVVLTARRRSRG